MNEDIENFAHRAREDADGRKGADASAIQAMAESVAASAWQAAETTELCGTCPGCRAQKYAEQLLALYEAMDGQWRIGNVTALGISGNRGLFIVVMVNDAATPAQVVTQIMIESEETK